MKGFTRMETRFFLYGLNCDLYNIHLGGYCPSCGGGVDSQNCTMIKCSLEHGGIQFYQEYQEYPYPRYDGIDDWDSLVPHRSQQQDVVRIQELELEVYLAQLGEKWTILNSLLTCLSDGCRKTLLSTAVYLLPLEDSQSVMADLDSRAELAGQSVKERTLAAAKLVQRAADRQGVSLKLNKKPKKGWPRGDFQSDRPLPLPDEANVTNHDQPNEYRLAQQPGSGGNFE